MSPAIDDFTRARRLLLRQQLLALVGITSDTDLIERQIDALLEKVWDDLPQTLPLRSKNDDLDEDQRIVVTGMGLVTPLGLGVASFWEGLTAGRSGVRRITICDPGESPVKIAAEVPNFDPHDYIEPKEARRISRASQFAVAAAQQAVLDAKLLIDDTNRDDVGVLIANGSTSPADTEAMAHTLFERGFQRVSPFYITAALPNMPSCQVAIDLGLTGYSTTISSACAASAQAIGEAAAVIRRGDADVMLAGGTEAPISQFALAGFCAIRSLSTANERPEAASRPFDAKRNGFVLGEGAGVLVLERLSDARRRGAPIYAEILGYASTCDAHHVTAPQPGGDGPARAMLNAMSRARIGPQQIDYINAHATSTPHGDLAETNAIKRAFGEYASCVPISSNKSMIGHLTSAAGVVEAAATILSLKHGRIPPTINYDHPDPECDLDYVPNVARSAALRIAMSNSFGFGGINAVLIFGLV
jgi:3-oxoacyl-[acyl-carrier-protein] synthase II